MSDTRDGEPDARKIARRGFLWSAGALAVPLLCSIEDCLVAMGKTSAGAKDPAAAERFAGMIIRSKEPENLEFPFSTLSDFITPTEQFYIRSHYAVPSLERSKWRLRVEGAVEHPFELSYEELLAMPACTITCMLECAGNSRVFIVPPVKGVAWELGAVSNAQWTGVPLASILERAGLKASAVEVVLEGADSGEIKDEPKPAGAIRFARSLSLEKARDPEVLLAYKMNGAELLPSHGFPLRAIVPGWYAMASVKWLTRITVIDHQFDGYYQTVDYAYWQRRDGLPTRVPISEMLVKSQIARPGMHETVPRNAQYRVYGAAWAGDTDVTKVEVSVDGGGTWSDAQLVGKPVRHAWRLWEYMWHTPLQPGRCTLMSRATDARGNVQPMKHDPDRANYMVNFVLPIDVVIA